jgi:Flp pilus assembly protein TadD
VRSLLRVRFVAYLVLSCVAAGCAGRRPHQVASAQPSTTAATHRAQQPPVDSLETFIAKVRQLSAEARPERAAAATIEGHDPRLGAALAAAMLAPSPSSYREAADEYRRLSIADQAHQYLGRALALDPQDPATHDALARLWRDTGFPHLALGDAYRGLHYAPDSPVLHNTVGTILQALGRRGQARARYERALELDPTAAYALNNLCYGWVIDGDAPRAIAACQHAIRLQPDLTAARNNLGLAHAVAGDVGAARAAFAETGDAAQTLYNTGIMHLARRDYARALKAFRDAQASRPGMKLAAARAKQAKALTRNSGY